MEHYDTSRQIRIVGSFDELVETPFSDGVNALCWPRRLPGDFENVVEHFPAGQGITPIDAGDLRALALGPTGAVARDVLLADLELLRGRGLGPTLDTIAGYPRDDTEGPVATDVYSFHVDSATIEADTYLCTYHGRSSEGLANSAAIRKVDDAQTRALLLQTYGGSDDEGFAAYLAEHCFDLHYAPLPNAAPFSFGIGNLWRIAIAYPGSPVLPCIHRAPPTLPGDPTRLLLIS
jgi:hypothetical protein